MTRPLDGPDSDGHRSYTIAHAALREQLIRSGSILPRSGDPVEEAWASEGPRPVQSLDAATGRTE